jgi:hypothetical protein
MTGGTVGLKLGPDGVEECTIEESAMIAAQLGAVFPAGSVMLFTDGKVPSGWTITETLEDGAAWARKD